MEKFALAVFVVRKKTALFILFAVVLTAAAVCIPFTSFNYDETLYLPASSGTKAGLLVMEAEFDGGGNAIAMLKGKNIEEILSVKTQIAATGGVRGAFWLDDILLPLTADDAGWLTDAQKIEYFTRAVRVIPKSETATVFHLYAALQNEFDKNELPAVISLMNVLAGDYLDASDEISPTKPLGGEYALAVSSLAEQIALFYKDGDALMTISFDESDYSPLTYKALGEIEKFSGDLYLSGNSASAYYAQQNQLGEIINATLLAAVIALAVLFLFSSSWFDPVVYIISIAAAMILNMGTNIFIGNVSYLTGSVACVLQLALSIDYSVFLLNRYKKERKTGKEAGPAMVEALKRSFAPISASSLTTIASFITIMFMKYRLGLDMGLVMAKAILMSLVTAFLLLPGVIVALDKKIAAAEHKTFNFSVKRLSRYIYKFRWGLALLAAALIIPAAFLAGRNTFVYGSQSMQSPDSKGILNRELIEKTFGSQETLALLVPKDANKELSLSLALAQTDGVESVTSSALLAAGGYGAHIPEPLKSQLVGAKDYNRVVLNLGCEEEGETAKALISEIRNKIENVYGSSGAKYYLLGNTAAAIDMEDNTKADFDRISLFSLLAVGLIVAFTFRSALIPIILVAAIQGSVWLNMAVPYLLGDKMIFLGYMIITNILLGATIDYAILLTSNYNESLEKFGAADSVREALAASLRPMLTSGGIFTLGGLILGFTSSFPTVQMLGYSIMRGGISAVAVTVFVLPALLAIFDKPIRFLKNSKTKTNDNIIR